MSSPEKALIDQLRATIKAAMEALPPGEHLHVAAIIAEQNAEIVRLKTLNRRLRAQRRAAPAQQAKGV